MDISKHIEEIRAEFPVTSYLKYMNSAAHGPALARVQEKTNDWWEFYTYENTTMKAPDAKQEVASALGVDKDDVTWVNRVARAHKCSFNREYRGFKWL